MNSLIWHCLNQMTSRPYDSFLMTHLMTQTTQSYAMTHMTFLYLIHYYSKPVNSLCHGPSDDDIYIKKGVFHSRSVFIPSGDEKFLQSCFPPVSPHFCLK